MKTKAVRLYGINDLRLEEFDLPQIKDDEILVKVVSDSICMSSHKLAMQGEGHKRVRHNLNKEQPIIGHEFCGIILETGSKWAHKFQKGSKFVIQPAMNHPDDEGIPTLWAPGYSFEYCGGAATYAIIPSEIMEMGCLLDYSGDNFYMGSLAEPASCIAGAFNAQYHIENNSYNHKMGIMEGGTMIILAGAGPMGLGSIDYAIHNPCRPSRLIVTDIDDARLNRAAQLLPVEEAKTHGVELIYVNTVDMVNPAGNLISMNSGKLFDDVFVFAPVKPLVELGGQLLGKDGCLNFFAGPTDTEFSASLNFYNVHYEGHHVVGTTGGNTSDMKQAISMMTEGKINPIFMITHIGGLDSVPEATVNLDKIPGGKKLIYTHKKLPLTAIEDFSKMSNPLFTQLAEICRRHNNLWSTEAENYLLENAEEI